MKQLFQTAVLDNDTFKSLWQQFFSNQLTDTQKTVLLSYCNWETLSQTQHRLIYTAWAESRTAWDWIGDQTVVDFNVGVSTNPNGHIYSLATALLLAGVGVPVVKTGDYGYGNYCGYSDILEYLGAKFARTSTDWRTSLEKTSFAYVHAPNAHRTLDALRTIRTDMGATTVLDTLQPLANVQTGVQLVVGAQTLSQQQYYNQLTTAAGGDVSILYDLSDAPCMTLAHDWQWTRDHYTETLLLSDWGLPTYSDNILHTDNKKTVAEASDCLLRLLNENGSEAENMVLIVNTAFVLQNLMPTLNMAGALAEAEASLVSGRALQVLERLLSATLTKA